jgi:hypothetical protein
MRPFTSNTGLMQSLNAIATPAAPGAGAFGDSGSEPYRGEGRLNWIRSSKVDPILGWVVVEREQHIKIINDLRRGLGQLGPVLGGERHGRSLGVCLVLGVQHLAGEPARGLIGDEPGDHRRVMIM